VYKYSHTNNVLTKMAPRMRINYLGFPQSVREKVKAISWNKSASPPSVLLHVIHDLNISFDAIKPPQLKQHW